VDVVEESCFDDSFLAHTIFAFLRNVHPVVLDVQLLAAEAKVNAYLCKRDQYRAESSPPRRPRWMGTTTALCGAMWKLGKRSVAARSRAVRIIWDKHLTGYN
jgi:hypothetical protein